MKDVGVGGRTSREECVSDAEAPGEEYANLIASGSNSGKRAGAIGLLAFVVIAGAAVCCYLSESGGDSFLFRLDSDLLTHAELALASREGGGRLAVVPSWPLRLYTTLRDGIVFYAVAAAAAAWLWSLSAKARARRDAFLIHEALTNRLDDMRRRLDAIEKRDRHGDGE